MKSGFELINEKVEEAGVQYLFQTTLQTLIVDENDMVARARFVDKDGNLVDIAAKAVALATGGALSGMGPVSNLTPRFEAGHMLGTFYPLLGLLPNGKRFYCETAVHNAATGALAAGYYEWYSVWDSVAQNGIDQEVILHAGDAVKTCDTIEELAEMTGMPLDKLQETFDQWKTICENQEDPDFKKTLFLQELKPPYYFLRNYPVRYKSLGGLAVSDRMEVLDADGNPIPNLYACGCTAGTEDITPAAGSGMLLGTTLAADYAK